MNNKKVVSYSQFSQWKECPYRWKLNYIDKLRVRTQSIATLFGTSMHDVLQTYLKTMYNETIEAASKIDLNKLLLERMKHNYAKYRKEGHVMDITSQGMAEHYSDGMEILDWFIRHRHDYFTKRGYELIGVEVPLNYSLSSNIKFNGFLDVVLKDTVTNRYKIYDIKTSAMGWNKYQKKDKNKLMQLVLYKVFYSMEFNVDPRDIDVEFIIVKRKLWEKADFPQKRVQRVEPASGSVTQKSIIAELNNFINMCFTDDGNYKMDVVHEKKPSVKACKYCEYKDKPELCDRNKKIRRKK